MRERKTLRLFLASPSDVVHERMIVASIVNELNSTVARHLGMLIELVRWEDMVPSLGVPQPIILEQADLEHTDIFIGIFWNRFGTPTDRAPSGTVEEFQIAHELWKMNGAPKTMLYFCQRPVNFRNTEDLNQKQSLLEFCAEARKLALIREFQELTDFESIVRQDLTNHLFRISAPIHSDTQSNPQHDPGRKDTLNQRDTSNPVVPPRDMIRIPAGAFIRGRSRQSAVVKNEFWIDVYPVTNSQYAEFIRTTGFMNRTMDAGLLQHLERLLARTEAKVLGAINANHPVTGITWYEAVAYTAWAGKRLPTALEWERAAAGIKGNLYPWGNDFSRNRCNSKNSSIGTTTPVNQYPEGKSDEGCYDMAGNVFEWTNDWAVNPRFSSAPSSEKINKGGSFAREASDLVNWYEESDPPDLRMNDVGFRCAWSPDNSGS
ncbi:MAG TPA: SUMF1/EgtB/PvdO family nonheme iron enzyme [Candidatus Angelobacter sp.]|nr:SUMF1/EgtB/PvdO family nonheme iron enzyme [Candidatus Angelobacter sp.]